MKIGSKRIPTGEIRGILKVIKHLHNSRLYRIWSSMKNRENNHDSTRPTYKGKKMCDEWKNSFTKFYDWAISHGYNDNCRFATPTQQVRNRMHKYHWSAEKAFTKGVI